MNLGLTGRRAVVTGASKGIGLAVTRALLQEGVRVAAGARHASAELTGTVEEADALVVLADLTTTDCPE